MLTDTHRTGDREAKQGMSAVSEGRLFLAGGRGCGWEGPRCVLGLTFHLLGPVAAQG